MRDFRQWRSKVGATRVQGFHNGPSLFPTQSSSPPTATGPRALHALYTLLLRHSLQAHRPSDQTPFGKFLDVPLRNSLGAKPRPRLPLAERSLRLKQPIKVNDDFDH